MAVEVGVVSLDRYNARLLQGMHGSEEHRFSPLLTYEQIGRDDPDGIDMDRLLDRARRCLDSGGSVDAITSFWDYPATEIHAILCAERGLPGPSPASVVLASHKFHSRVVQRECVADHVPAFCAVDVFDDDSVASIGLRYPYWLKPVRCYSSHLGFRVGSRRDLARAVTEIRQKLPRLARGFDQVLEHPFVPDELASVGGRWCVAEAIVGGAQATLEGWVHHGEICVYGVVDSIRERNRSSFNRYQYPSSLPAEVQAEMVAVARRFIEHIGYDNAAFNVELFWERRSGRIWILEMNTRCSQSHADLFCHVEGNPNLQVAVDVALGRRPRFGGGAGPYSWAAKCFLRHRSDGVVTSVPDPAGVTAEYPQLSVRIAADVGTRLSEMRDQESYSYELGTFCLAADSRGELARLRREVAGQLRFEVDPV